MLHMLYGAIIGFSLFLFLWIITKAKGVGIGSAVNKLNNELAMVATVKGLRRALDSFQMLSTINQWILYGDLKWYVS